MKIEICERCGGGEFVDQGKYRVCQYCNSKYLITPEDVTRKESSIALDNDIKMLLQKCQDYPANARRYASLILDIDPGNLEALKYI
jgi:DNA-directed RNA polymerase subunit RPC12/RpoP